MSFDISLKDPVTNEILELPVEHIMTGGTYAAVYNEDTHQFSPKPTREAWLNVTYNYSHYYSEAAEDDARFEYESFRYDKDGAKKDSELHRGIRGLTGKSGAESISMLEDMITKIIDKYKQNGDWITTKRDYVRNRDLNGNIVDPSFYFSEIMKGNKDLYTEETYVEDVYEGLTNDYWQPTAANALKPLYQLITMAKLRPDGVWEVL